MKTPTHIILHNTAVSYNKNPDQANATNMFHKKWKMQSSLGYWAGYTYEISKTGKITQFRKDGEVSAAQFQQNMNDGRAISICLDGYFDKGKDYITPEQFQACQKLMLDKMKQYNIPPENVWPHRRLAKYKSCPGTNFPDDLASFFQLRSEPTKPESPTGSTVKRKAVMERIAKMIQRRKLLQKTINLFSKEK